LWIYVKYLYNSHIPQYKKAVDFIAVCYNSSRVLIPSGFDLEPSAIDNEGLGYVEMVKVFIKRAMINMKGLYLHNYQMLQVPIYS
jgi:hypothetical protein